MNCKNCQKQITKGSKSGFCQSCFQIGKKKNFTKATLIAISERAKERNRKRIGTHLSKVTKEKIGKANKISQKGKKLSEITKIKISKGLSGKKSYLWKGGITTENNKIRTSREMKLWKKSVFERDNFTCQKYNIRGGRIVAHHINNFADFPELRVAIDNGITLSQKAHKEFHKKYGIKNNTREQLMEFLK